MSANIKSINWLDSEEFRSHLLKMTPKATQDLIPDNDELLNNNNEGEDFHIPALNGDIKSFYANSTVFLTGATGFLGKAIVEKLLRSCGDVKMIYILMRPKEGLTVDLRFKDFLKNVIFDNIRENWPERLDKVRPIKGDVAQPNLGMLSPDLVRLAEEVNIVIHSAATVRFVEPLSEALKLNTLGTKRIMEMCHTMKNLKSVVHVSTAYSNSIRHDVEEKVYPTDHDADALLQCANILPSETIDQIGSQLLKEHPNTYTFTKALAEQIVKKHGAGLPICIFRPSIVTAAIKDPFPGWIDNLFGVTGVMMEMYKGTIRTAIGVNEYDMNIIPVDFAVNACLAVAWHQTHYKSKEPKVYNCTSGPVNPISWGNFLKYLVNHSREYPSMYTMMYPDVQFTTNTALNNFWEIVSHWTPATLFDLLLKIQGKKPMMIKMVRRFKRVLCTGQYFAVHSWNFGFSRMTALLKDLERSKQSAEFPCDFQTIDWDNYISLYMVGIRRYIFKESDDTLPEARRKLQRLLWLRRIVQGASGYCVLKMLLGKS